MREMCALSAAVFGDFVDIVVHDCSPRGALQIVVLA